MSTRKLAKELGLLRQRSQSSDGTKKPLVSNQIFSYLIVIDFESTCWRGKNTYSQEIIEFPAVLLNTSTGEVESEFHTYVQPQEHPILSEFCTELTGITQMQVEEGIPLQICLSRFTRWLQNLQLKMGVVFPNNQTSSAPSASQKLCTFLTWSDWDLGVCLQYECKRKQLHKPDVLNSWIDLRSTYRMFYNKKPKGLNGALQDLGIQFEGREHSGLDDSRNTAQLAVRMMRDGCVMKITRSLGRTSIVKPMFGNTTADTKREKFNILKEEKNPITTKPLSSSNPSTSFQIKTCLDTGKNFDTKESMCRSLVSPKTLLNGTTVPLGTKSLSAEVLTKTSPLVITDCPSPHSNNNINNLVLCSTIVSCLSNQIQINQPAKTGVAEGLWEKEDSAETFSLETEDRCGSYDDVVLEGDDEVISKTERQSDIGYASDFDSGSSVWEEPDNTHSPGGHIPSRHNVTVSAEDKLIPQEVIKESTMISTSTKVIRSSVNVCNNTSEIRQHSMIPISNPSFPVPKNVTQDFKFNLHNTGLKASLKTLANSHGLHKFSKANTPIPFKNEPFIPKKTSTPNSSLAQPKTVTTQHTGHKVACSKVAPKSSFKIYTAKSSCSSFTGSLCAPKNVLSSLSVNTLSTGTNTSTVSVSMKGLQRITSPLCLCGRRSKRQLVSNGGPNHGRGFYCCPVRRSGSGGRMQKGCEFFKWESALIKNCSAASPAASVSLSDQLVSEQLPTPNFNHTKKLLN